MASSEKTYLNSLARKTIQALERERISKPFLVKLGDILDVNTGGWSIQIGYFRGFQCSMELWLDQFAGGTRRKLYYCVISGESAKIKGLVRLAKPLFGEHLSVHHSDWSSSDEIIQLGMPLAPKDFGKPLFEQYPTDDQYFYGIYDRETPAPEGPKMGRLIERITGFVGTLNAVLLNEKIMKDSKTRRAIENERSKRTGLVRERNGYLMALRKQRDNYTCKVCGMKFVEIYGPLGENFAEAHHRIPLRTGNTKRISTIEDLITVCANCHRMLDRMEGKAGDVVRLRQIIKRNRINLPAH